MKGYAATGSKMSDIIGDLDAIIGAKRHDTALLFVTDGTTQFHLAEKDMETGFRTGQVVNPVERGHIDQLGVAAGDQQRQKGERRRMGLEQRR